MQECNLCPAGWQVPTDEDWGILKTYLGGEVAAGKMKEAGSTHWRGENVGATNESGWSGFPDGNRSGSNGVYSTSLYNGYWWSTTEHSNTTDALAHFLTTVSGTITGPMLNRSKTSGLSVRCLRHNN